MLDTLDSTITVTTDNADSYTIDYNSTLMASSVSTGPIMYTTTPGFNGSSLNYQIGNSSTDYGALQVNGDANFDGNVKVKGVDLCKLLEDIQKRLSILVPDPAKLEKYEALKKAYDHYKMLEALCDIENKTKE